MDVKPSCTIDCERRVICKLCGRIKAPSGRSVPLEVSAGYCSHDCDGYWKDPKPGHLWPGELTRGDERD